MLKITGLNVEYKEGFKALSDIDVNIDDGQCVGLIGANGAGKSSLFRAITGLIHYDGKVEVDASSDISVIRKSVGYVIQESDDQMFMPTVIEDMIFGPVNCGMSKDEAMEKVAMVVEGVHSAKAAKKLAEKYNIEMPIVDVVNAVLFDNMTANEAVKELMTRSKKDETSDLEW